jgi:purine nucleosidase
LTYFNDFRKKSDPIAASLVIHSDLNIHMVPLEATNNVDVTREMVSNLRKSHSTRFMNVVTHMLEFLLNTQEQAYKNNKCPLIDPVAAFYLIRPDLFKTKLIRVDVDTGTLNYSYGQTACDLYELTDRKKNVQVCYELDNKGAEIFWSYLIDTLLKANDVSKNFH